MKRSEYIKQWKENRKSQGLCVGCGKPIDRDGTYCAECRKKINTKTRETRKWYLEHNICPICRKNDLLGDETICPECRAQSTNNILSKRNRSEYNAYHSEWSRNTYRKRKELGICVKCGKRKATEANVTCALCRSKYNETRRARARTSDRSDRIKNGVCYFCNNPVKEGYKVCEKHYKMNVEKAAIGRETQAAQEYIKNMKKIQYRSVRHG